MDELAERDATGDIAAIYDEIRRFWAVPYVSSMQRHLATRPGWLEWVWAALRPVFASGLAQTAAWRAADGLVVPQLAPIGRDALPGRVRGAPAPVAASTEAAPGGVRGSPGRARRVSQDESRNGHRQSPDPRRAAGAPLR